jgi:hypothetical protein
MMTSASTETSAIQKGKVPVWADFFFFLPGALKPYSHGLFFFFLCLIFALHPFGDLQHLSADQLCQITYFNFLYNPHLAGSVGMGSVKPGVVLVLGAVYEMSQFLFGNIFLVWILFIVLAALLTWLLMQGAAYLGGQSAGWAALGLLFCTNFSLHFLKGTSQIFFLPTVLGGLILMSRNKPFGGLFLVFLSGLFRVEGFFVGFCLLASLSFNQHITTKQRNLLAFGFLVFTILFVGITGWVQGGLHRFAGGATVGYTLGQTLFESAWADGLELLREVLSYNWIVTILILPSFWWLYTKPKTRFLAPLLYIPVFLLIYKSLSSADLRARYFLFLSPLTIIVCVGSSFQLLQHHLLNHRRWRRPIVRFLSALCLFAGGIVFFLNTGTLDLNRLGYTNYPDGRLAAQEPIIPPGMRVLADDHMLFAWLMETPNYFQNVRAVQAFEQKPLKTQEEEIRDFDYIYVVTAQEDRPFTFLNFVPKNQNWNNPFRQSLIRALSTGEPAVFGSITFHRLHLDELRGIIRIVSSDPH